MFDNTKGQLFKKRSFINNSLKSLSAIFIFLMMFVTFSDVIGRYFFNSPISGATEIISFLLGLTIFSAFPLVTRDRNHITVGLFERFFYGKVRYFQRLLVLFITMGIVVFVAFLMFDQALTMYFDGALTEYLDLPEAPIVFVFCGLVVLAALIFSAVIWRYISNGGDPKDGASTDY